MYGKVIIFSAPSGAGKSTIVRNLLELFPNEFSFAISATTRKPRTGEKDGVHYYYLSKEDFEARIKAGEFIEYEEVYNGIFYGTLKKEVEKIWASGKGVLFDVDVVGGKNLKAYFADQALSVFVKVESLDILKQRLADRNTEKVEELNYRLEKAAYEMTFEKYFDKTLVNHDLDVALNELKEWVSSFLKK